MFEELKTKDLGSLSLAEIEEMLETEPRICLARNRIDVAGSPEDPNHLFPFDFSLNVYRDRSGVAKVKIEGAYALYEKTIVDPYAFKDQLFAGPSNRIAWQGAMLYHKSEFDMGRARFRLFANTFCNPDDEIFPHKISILIPYRVIDRARLYSVMQERLITDSANIVVSNGTLDLSQLDTDTIYDIPDWQEYLRPTGPVTLCSLYWEYDEPGTSSREMSFEPPVPNNPPLEVVVDKLDQMYADFTAIATDTIRSISVCLGNPSPILTIK